MKFKKTAQPQSGLKSPEDGELNLEEYFVNRVKKRQTKVDRLERELIALKEHCTKLFESFSVPIYPQGYDPVAGRLENTVAESENINENVASKTDHKAGSTPPSHALAGASTQRQSPSSRTRNEVEFRDEANRIEEAVPIPTVKSPIPTETLSSSTSASDSKEARNVMDWTNDNDIDLMKDGIRRERQGVKISRKSSTKPNGTSIRTPEKNLGTSLSADSESSDEESSNYEGSESESEDSAEFDSDELDELESNENNDSDCKEVSSEEISSSSASDSLAKQKLSPVKMKSPSGERANTTWKPKTKASSSSSEDSGESSSSSDEDNVRNKRHAQIGRTSLGRAKEPEVPKPVPTTSLSPNASSEDLFDWKILGLQGPWLPLTSSEEPSGASLVKNQALSLKFLSMATYTATFQMLIGEEAKAILLSEWEQFKAEHDLNGESTTESPSVDSRGQSSVWQLRSMVQTMGDPFHYFEAECIEGQYLKFDAGEFLCMIVPGTGEVKAVAIVNHQDRYQAPLLKTRIPWDFSFDKCVLLRLCNMVTLRRMFLAVSTLSEIFSPLQQQILDPLANRKFLKPLPALEDIVGGDPKPILRSESLRNFSDRKILNTVQLLTVSHVLDMRQGFQLVQGPPGTGKTSTIVGMVSTLLIEEPGVRILVCAPSNAALDEVAARLMHRMLDKSGNAYSPMDGTIVRFGAKRVMHPIVQLISLDTLTLRLSSSSHRSRAWVDILDAASVVCATLSGCGNTTFDELEKLFDVVIIDEAAQAVEAEVLIALKRVKGRCVMVGDPQQLPATVFQQPSTAYGRSLFERFQQGGVPVHVLTTQYRMHPSICSYPSQQFYGGALRDSPWTIGMQSIFNEEVCGRGMTIRGCRFKLGHYCFMDVGWGTEREELVGHSRANFEEALVVCNVVEGAVKGLLPGLKPNVGVITPYIAQRGVIERELEKRGIDSTACEVNTVDGFQGREKDVIVLSCVRAMADKGLGFVSNERRMNVALTRAKYALIIVGHAETLQKWSPAWGSLIDDAQERGCYQVLTNNKTQDIFPRNWKPNPPPRKDMYGTIEVEEKSQDLRKRSSNCAEDDRSHKPTTANTNSTMNGNDKQDKGKARKDEDGTQMPSRNSKRAGAEEKVDGEPKVKRKRQALEVKGSTKTSVDMSTVKKNRKATGNSPDLLVHPKKKKCSEVEGRILGSTEKKRKKSKVELDLPGPSGGKKTSVDVSTVKKSGKATGNSPDLLVRSKKKKSKVEERILESSEKKRKKPKVELDLPGPSATKRPPKKLKEVKLEFPKDKKRKLRPVICLPAPALYPASNRKGKKTAKSLELPLQLKKPKVEPESGPEASTEARKVEANEIPLMTTVKQEEVIMYEVTSSARGDDHKDFGKTQIPAERSTDPVLQSTDRNTGTERRSRGWFPNPVSEDDRRSLQNGQFPPRSVHPSHPSSTTQGFANFDEHAVESRLPHWGNSYGLAPSSHNRFRGQEMDLTSGNLSSVLRRANDYFGMQPDNNGNFQQEPRNHWQHPISAHMSPHGNQFGVHHHFSNADHRQPPRPPRPAYSAPSQNHYSSNSQSTHLRGRGRKGHFGRRSGGMQSYRGR